MEESTRASSIAIKPSSIGLLAGHPYPVYDSPAMRRLAIRGMSSKGNSALAQYWLMTGATASSMNARTRPTIWLSSSFKSDAMS